MVSKWQRHGSMAVTHGSGSGSGSGSKSDAVDNAPLQLGIRNIGFRAKCVAATLPATYVPRTRRIGK
jgi:hypothetical protein